MTEFQTELRIRYGPDLDLAVLPAVRVLPSAENTVVEGGWKHHRQHTGLTAREVLRGRDA